MRWLRDRFAADAWSIAIMEGDEANVMVAASTSQLPDCRLSAGRISLPYKVFRTNYES